MSGKGQIRFNHVRSKKPKPEYPKTLRVYVRDKAKAGVEYAVIAKEVRKIWPEFGNFSARAARGIAFRQKEPEQKPVHRNQHYSDEKRPITLAGPAWSHPQTEG